MAAQDTAAILQQAAQGGLAIMIPGAREPRILAPPVRTISVTTGSAAISGRERLEREREGGGAPSERTPGRHRTVLANLWHCTFHPADISLLWRQPLPSEP